MEKKAPEAKKKVKYVEKKVKYMEKIPEKEIAVNPDEPTAIDPIYR